MAELATQGVLRELPASLSATAMSARQDAVLDEIGKNTTAVLIKKSGSSRLRVGKSCSFFVQNAGSMQVSTCVFRSNPHLKIIYRWQGISSG
jgi:hypothetical protein